MAKWRIGPQGLTAKSSSTGKALAVPPGKGILTRATAV
ncbi:hypothetical protein Vi05172_g1511 [Venturia inaequalis]|nr:hypothetical protein Vi05172_g1511 [Venturia inaequalis]